MPYTCAPRPVRNPSTATAQPPPRSRPNRHRARARVLSEHVDCHGIHPPTRDAARACRAVRARLQLLEAASEIFVERGYHSARAWTDRDPRRRSANLFSTSTSPKLDLYLAVVDSHAEKLVSDVNAALLTTTDNKQRVRAAVKAFFDFIDEDNSGYRLIFSSDAIDPAVIRRIESATEGCVDAVYGLVMHDSGFDPHRSRMLAAGLVGASQVNARYWLEAKRPVDKQTAIDTTVALLWGGLSHVPLQGSAVGSTRREIGGRICPVTERGDRLLAGNQEGSGQRPEPPDSCSVRNRSRPYRTSAAPTST